MLKRSKHTSLLQKFVAYGRKLFITLATGVQDTGKCLSQGILALLWEYDLGTSFKYVFWS